MNNMERVYDSRKELADMKLPGSFATLFKGIWTDKDKDDLFHAGLHARGLLNNDVWARNIPFAKKMNELGVVLFGWYYSHNYVFTKTHLFVYDAIDSFEKINIAKSNNGTNRWKCKDGNLLAIIPLTNIKSIDSNTGIRYSHSEAITVQEEGNPVLGAVIGGAIAGPTGAVVGAIANSGKREKTIVNANSTEWVKSSITVATEQGTQYQMDIASTVKNNSDKKPELSPYDYGNHINKALAHGFRFSAESVNNGTATKEVIETLSRYITDSRRKSKEKVEAEAFWNAHPLEKEKLNVILDLLQNEYNSRKREVRNVSKEIDEHVLEAKEKTQDEIDTTKRLISVSGFFMSFKLKKEIQALENKLATIQIGKDFDEFMTTRNRDLVEATQRLNLLEKMVNAFSQLNETINSKTLARYLRLIMDNSVSISADDNSQDYIDHFIKLVQEYK